MKQFGVQVAISSSVILIIALLVFVSSRDRFVLFFALPVLFGIIANVIFSGIIYYINKKVSVYVSVFIFILCAWFLKIINKNYNE